MPSPLPAQHLHHEYSPNRLAFYRAGSAQPLLVQNAVSGLRPFIHPILAPDGEGALTENEPAHHKWQHGLYVGLNRVNDHGFWMEGCFGDPLDGSFDPAPLAPPEPAAHGGFSWQVETGWRDPQQRLLLDETQLWTLTDRGEALVLDVVWTLRAAVNLTFGAYAYGGLFLRMPWRKETHGDLLTSEGATSHTEAEARPARWVALSMPIPGRTRGPAGFAFFDHPSNPGHPSPWRVDDQLGIAPSRCIDGEWTLSADRAATHRYRLVAFTGAIDSVFIEAEWHRYASTHASA